MGREGTRGPGGPAGPAGPSVSAHRLLATRPSTSAPSADPRSAGRRGHKAALWRPCSPASPVPSCDTSLELSLPPPCPRGTPSRSPFFSHLPLTPANPRLCGVAPQCPKCAAGKQPGLRKGDLLSLSALPGRSPQVLDPRAVRESGRPGACCRGAAQEMSPAGGLSRRPGAGPSYPARSHRTCPLGSCAQGSLTPKVG